MLHLNLKAFYNVKRQEYTEEMLLLLNYEYECFSCGSSEEEQQEVEDWIQTKGPSSDI